MSSSTTDISSNEQSPLREELVGLNFLKIITKLLTHIVPYFLFKIQTAVKFLQNQNVINTPLVQKQKFLQRKGLSDREIQVACERSGAYDIHEKQQVPVAPIRTMVPLQYGQMQQQYSWFERLKEIVHNTAVISALAYAIYMFYQVCLGFFNCG